MATSVGYAMAAVPPPKPGGGGLAGVGFCDLIAFANRLSGSARLVSKYSPVVLPQPAADLMRSALAGSREFSATQLCVLLGWTGLGIILSMLALVRKR